MRVLKVMALLLALLVLVLGAWSWQNREHLAAFPDILSAYTAKEYCSCRYVSGYSAQYCQGFVKQWLPLDSFAADDSARQVTATGLGRSNTARWLNERQGCRLDP